jgi:hypothetical protein
MEVKSLSSSTPGQHSQQAALRKQVDEFVGITFYGTMMKAMRNSTIKGKYGHGGRGEEVFQSQLDFELASRMGRSQHNSLNEAVYRRFAGEPTSSLATVMVQTGGLQDQVEKLRQEAGVKPAILR